MQSKEHESFNFHYYSAHLQEKLSQLSTVKAAVIEAPSGYGKTTAVRDYLRAATAHGDALFWFTAVDEAPTALYRRLCMEIEKIDARTGECLRKIDFPNAFTIGDACDALRSIECHHKTWLVIDEFQFFFDILPPSFLSALLDHGGTKLHLIIITQTLGQGLLSVLAGRRTFHITASDLHWDTEDIHRYSRSIGMDVPKTIAREVKKHTDGWIIAVYLQLCAYHETGTFSGEALFHLMEHLIWNKITNEQQILLMYLSPFESWTTAQICAVLKCDTLPDYALESLSIPFIRYNTEHMHYEMHAILRDLVKIKRRERGAAFEKKCFIKVGDLMRDDGKIAEALAFYTQVKDYQRILSLNLSHLIYAETGDSTFHDIALDIAQNCPASIRCEYPLSMLFVAWAIRLLDREALFAALMTELDCILPETGLLRAEWTLLSAYLHFPCLESMLSIIQKAADLFQGSCSQVILPEAPWAFYEYIQLTAFHTQVGKADQEADLLEIFIALYSNLTNGHGLGADALFRAELAFLRGDTVIAEIFAYKAVFLAENKQQKIIQIGAARMLAEVALHKADTAAWQRAVDTMEQAATGAAQNTPLFRAVLDVVRASLLIGLKAYMRIADWVKNIDFTARQLPISIKKKALYVHRLYLMGKGDYAQAIGLGQTLSFDHYTLFPACSHVLITAFGFSALDDYAQAALHLEHAIKKALPDALIHPFAVFSQRLPVGLLDDLIEKNYPHLLAHFKDYTEHYIAGWSKLHSAITASELPSELTVREREIALLAADGLRNNEIAEMLFLSENTIRAHLRTIYQKLDIDRRAKLAEKLK